MIWPLWHLMWLSSAVIFKTRPLRHQPPTNQKRDVTPNRLAHQLLARLIPGIELATDLSPCTALSYSKKAPRQVPTSPS